MRWAMVGLVVIGCNRLDAREVVGAQGEYAVGHQRASFTYDQVGSGQPREIPVEIWYPAVDGGEPSAEYGIAGVVEFVDALVLSDAAVEDGDFPVLVYSHGSGGVGALGYPYAQLMASHGWVVVAPDHIGNTSNDLLTGGASFLQSAVDRPEDVSALLDALDNGSLSAEITAVADVDRTAVIGHSFGGYTTFRAPGNGLILDGFGCDATPAPPECEALTPAGVTESLTAPTSDPRVKAILPQAPAFAAAFNPSDLAASAPPMLLMSGARDRTTPDATEASVFWDATRGPDDHWLKIPDGAHYSFITVCDDVPPALLAFLGAEGDGCDDTFTPPSELVPAMASYTLAFANWHVEGETAFEVLFDDDAAPLLSTVQLEGRAGTE